MLLGFGANVQAAAHAHGFKPFLLPANKDLNGCPYEISALCSTGHEPIAVKVLNNPALH